MFEPAPEPIVASQGSQAGVPGVPVSGREVSIAMTSLAAIVGRLAQTLTRVRTALEGHRRHEQRRALQSLELTLDVQVADLERYFDVLLDIFGRIPVDRDELAWLRGGTAPR